ncbi:MAG: FAD-dependent oxidoreductase, partial [Mycobacteriales bacterium]
MQRVAVVGAGLAGSRVCQELRSQGYDGSITLLGAEEHLPYDRPPLSKDLLFGRIQDTTLPMAWEVLDVDVRTGVGVTGLQPGQLATSAGDVAFDRAVVAVGAT